MLVNGERLGWDGDIKAYSHPPLSTTGEAEKVGS
jgi:hypothetical protein